MIRGGRLSSALLIVVALFFWALPALAQEDDEGTTTTTTTMPAEQITPAVLIEPPAASAETPDWTYRYLIPTGLVLAALVILITSVRYFTNVVRKRYRIIEE